MESAISSAERIAEPDYKPLTRPLAAMAYSICPIQPSDTIMLTILGTVFCPVSKPTLDAILMRYGLRADQRELSKFDVISVTRHSDPVVERDLFDLALNRMAAAHADGALPSWSRIR